MKRLRWTVVLVAAATLLAGCGEISNTLTAQPGTENIVTVALDAAPNFTQVGIFEAEALGYFKQTDMKVRFITPANPVAALENKSADIAITSEPTVLLERNKHIALAAVAALTQSPAQVTVTCRNPGGPKKSATTTATTSATTSTATTTTTAKTATSAPRSHPPLHAAICTAATVASPDKRWIKAPTYNGLNFVVAEDEIVNNAPILRRFVQAVGRGYEAARKNPEAATANLVKLNPSLNQAQQLAGVKASMANFFPTVQPGEATAHEWGWQTVSDWNRFGSWLLNHHIITNVNATPDADTNELLAGQGV